METRANENNHRTFASAEPNMTWVALAELPVDKQQSLVSRVHVLPRPSKGVHELVSEAFIQKATSVDLGKLVLGEPVMAAKILARVNSPAYGLRNPVSNIGQAITFLGMNQVRALCIQTMLTHCFVSKDPQTLHALDVVSRTSSAALLLLPRLAKIFDVKDVSGVTSQLILAGVGQLAAAILMPAKDLPSWMQKDRTERYQLEQNTIGINAAELTYLVLKTWELPKSLKDDILVSEQLLVTLPTNTAPAAINVAVAYLAQWIGEQLVRKLGGADDPQWTPLQSLSVELKYLRQLLALLKVDRNEVQLADDTSMTLYATVRDAKL